MSGIQSAAVAADVVARKRRRVNMRAFLRKVRWVP
jgi:hypothetical protein